MAVQSVGMWAREEPDWSAALPEPPSWMAERPDWPDEPHDDWPSAAQLIEELEQLKADAAVARTPAAAPADPRMLDDAALLTALDEAHRGAAAAHARWLSLLGEVESRALTLHQHAMPTASWLAAGTSHSTRAAHADVRLAERLGRSPQVASALAAGAMSVEQATSIVQGLDHLPHDLDAGQREAVEAQLVEFAADFNPTALRHLVNRAVEVVAPEVVEEHDRQALERAEHSQRLHRHVGWRTDPEDGGLRFWGKLPSVEGEMFRQHLSALAAGQRTADAPMGFETTQGQALADALALAVGHHATCVGGPAKGGDATRVIVTLDLDVLVTGVGVASLVESDERVSAGQVRHLACTAGLVPLVLDGESLPLELGRSKRLFTPYQRQVLAVRDRGCAFPGCDRLPSDCQAHHALEPWRSGGLTDVEAGVLLCPHHHHLVEPDPAQPPERNWRITFDARGRPVFHGPARGDGQRIVRQHQRYRT